MHLTTLYQLEVYTQKVNIGMLLSDQKESKTLEMVIERNGIINGMLPNLLKQISLSRLPLLSGLLKGILLSMNHYNFHSFVLSNMPHLDLR